MQAPGKVQAPGKEQAPGKVIVMSRSDRAWADSDTRSEPEDGAHHSVFGTRRMAAMAAMVARATAAGAVGGALATSAFMMRRAEELAPGLTFRDIKDIRADKLAA